MGMAYFAGRSPAIGDVVGRPIFRGDGEGDSICISAFSSGEEQLLYGVLCPDESGDRFSRGSFPASRPIISTTSYS